MRNLPQNKRRRENLHGTMVDFLSPRERSVRMSRIRDKDTAPELALRRELHRLGFRYRLHGTSLPGRPDIVLRKHKAVVFVHGCFWHRHDGCKIASIPKSNTEFWLQKFEKNVARDRRVSLLLVAEGWRVFIVWECELSPGKISETAQRLAMRIRG